MANSQIMLSFAAAASAGLLSGAIIWAIRPLLLHVALAKPNARSSHCVPTPQGAGIAVVAATLIVAAAIIAFAEPAEVKIPIAVFGATLIIAAVGFADDVHSIPVFPRLFLQGSGRRGDRPCRARISPDRSNLPSLARAGAFAAGRPVVREPSQLHGRAGSYDGSRDRSDHRRARCARLARRTSSIDHHCVGGAVWRDARVRTVQPAGSADFPGRRRQPADWPAGRAGACCNSPGITNLPPPCCCRSII